MCRPVILEASYKHTETIIPGIKVGYIEVICNSQLIYVIIVLIFVNEHAVYLFGCERY